MTVPVRPRTTRPSPTPPAPARRRWLPPAVVGARLVLAAVLLWAALAKVGDPAATVRAVRAYQLLPEWLVEPVAHALPPLELALAALLLLGVGLRVAGAVTAALLGAFVVGIGAAWARGLQIDCGCFGGGGPTDDPQYAVELARDTAFLGLAVLVAVAGRSTRRLAAHRHTVVAVAALVVTSVLAVLLTPVPASPAGAAVPAAATPSGGLVVGDPDAPRRLVVFEDPQCPACGAFEQLAGPVLAAAVDRGQVAVEHRLRSFLGPESVRAVGALAAAADAGRFAELHALVFARQPQEGSGGFSADDLLALGREAGLADEAYASAVRDGRYAGWAATVDEQASRDGNVRTPELRLDGVPLEPEVAFDPQRLAQVLGLG